MEQLTISDYALIYLMLGFFLCLGSFTSLSDRSSLGLSW